MPAPMGTVMQTLPAAALWEAEVAAAAEAQLALERVGALAEQLTQDLGGFLLAWEVVSAVYIEALDV